jgi:hypothetical protein
MKHNLKTFVMNTLIVGALMTPASALAKDYWHWHDNRWDHRADLRSDIHDLQEPKDSWNTTNTITQVVAKLPKTMRGSET